MTTSSSITLPDQVGNIFPKVYAERIIHDFQQFKSKLMNSVTNTGFIKGDKAYFPRMGAIVAQDLVRFQEIVLSNGAHKLIEITCAAKIAAMPLADVDKSKVTSDLAPSYSKATVAAIERDLDKTIYTAVKTAADAVSSEISTIGNYNSDLDFATILQAIAMLDDVEALDGEQITLVLPAMPRAKLTADLSLAMKDNSNSTVGQGALKFLNPLEGVEVITYSGCSRITSAPSGDPALTAGVIGTDVFVYAKSAVGSAFNDNPTPVNERLGNIMTDMKGVWSQVGSAVLLPAGVIRIKCRRNPVIAITPLPTKAVA